MCLILDTNAFHCFFDPKNQDHNEFKPAMEWVYYGKGKLVYGGSKYKEELKKAAKYIKHFASLKRAGKIVLLSDKLVDEAEKKIKELEQSKDFDDPHLLAIVSTSNCKIVCTSEKRAIPFIKNAKLYVNGAKKAKIYGSSKNKSLLTDSNIANICKPCKKLNKSQAEAIQPIEK